MNACPSLQQPPQLARIAVLCLALGSMSAVRANEALATPTARPTFNLRAAEPDVGSHLPRRLVSGSAIPLDQTFKPARCGGQPCTMAFPIRFELNRRLL